MMIFSDLFHSDEKDTAKAEALRIIEENVFRCSWQEGIDPADLNSATFTSDGSLGQDELRTWLDRLDWAQTL